MNGEARKPEKSTIVYRVASLQYLHKIIVALWVGFWYSTHIKSNALHEVARGYDT